MTIFTLFMLLEEDGVDTRMPLGAFSDIEKIKEFFNLKNYPSHLRFEVDEMILNSPENVSTFEFQHFNF